MRPTTKEGIVPSNKIRFPGSNDSASRVATTAMKNKMNTERKLAIILGTKYTNRSPADAVFASKVNKGCRKTKGARNKELDSQMKKPAAPKIKEKGSPTSTRMEETSIP